MVRSRQVQLALAAMTSPVMAAARDDMQAQLEAMLYPGFVADTGVSRLRDIERYLRGILARCDRAPSQPSRDLALLHTVSRVQAEYHTLVAALPASRRSAQDVLALRWMIEELRVSLFAQTLGTAYPVSEKRIYKAMDRLEYPPV
jgi:ATP-dependent helicase HrpA